MAVLDIERRIAMAVLELLRKWTDLTALVAVARINTRRDAGAAVSYPAAWVQAINFAQPIRATGWYLGALQLGAVTYRADDPSQDGVEQILGALRGWAQQTDLITQLNASAAATAATTALTVDYAVCDGAAFDWSESRINERIVTVTLHARPSRTA